MARIHGPLPNLARLKKVRPRVLEALVRGLNGDTSEIEKDRRLYGRYPRLHKLATVRPSLITWLTEELTALGYEIGGDGEDPEPTPDEIILEDSPVGFWKLSESEGTVAADSSGNEIHGEYKGNPLLGVPGVLEGDTAVTLDGSTQFVLLGEVEALKLNPTSWTLEAVLKYTETPTGRIYRWRNHGHILYVHNGVVWVAYYDADTNLKLVSGPTLNDGEYHHVVGRFNGATLDLWVDGVKWAGVETTAPTHYSSGGAAIGAEATGGTALAATIDMVAVYGDALADERIAAHAAAYGLGGE